MKTEIRSWITMIIVCMMLIVLTSCGQADSITENGTATSAELGTGVSNNGAGEGRTETSGGNGTAGDGTVDGTSDSSKSEVEEVVECTHVIDSTDKLALSTIKEQYRFNTYLEEMYVCVEGGVQLKIGDVEIVAGTTKLGELSEVLEYRDPYNKNVNMDNTYVIGDSCGKSHGLYIKGSDSDEVAAYFEVKGEIHNEAVAFKDAVITDIRLNVSVLKDVLTLNGNVLEPSDVVGQYENMFKLEGNSYTKKVYSQETPYSLVVAYENFAGTEGGTGMIHVSFAEQVLYGKSYLDLVTEHVRTCKTFEQDVTTKELQGIRELNLFGEKLCIGDTLSDWLGRDNVVVGRWYSNTVSTKDEGSIGTLVIGKNGGVAYVDLTYDVAEILDACTVKGVQVSVVEADREKVVADALYGLRVGISKEVAEEIMELIISEVEAEFGAVKKQELAMVNSVAYLFGDKMYTDDGTSIYLKYDDNGILEEFSINLGK